MSLMNTATQITMNHQYECHEPHDGLCSLGTTRLWADSFS